MHFYLFLFLTYLSYYSYFVLYVIKTGSVIRKGNKTSLLPHGHYIIDIINWLCWHILRKLFNDRFWVLSVQHHFYPVLDPEVITHCFHSLFKGTLLSRGALVHRLLLSKCTALWLDGTKATVCSSFVQLKLLTLHFLRENLAIIVAYKNYNLPCLFITVVIVKPVNRDKPIMDRLFVCFIFYFLNIGMNCLNKNSANALIWFWLNPKQATSIFRSFEVFSTINIFSRISYRL